MSRVSVIIAAAGLGLRMGGEVKKPYLLLQGKPIFQHSLERFVDVGLISEIILVVCASEMNEFKERWSNSLSSYRVMVKIVAGGRRRQDSVANGLRHLEGQVEIVLVHDAVRPIITREMIETVIQKTEEKGAAILAVPVQATVKEVDGVQRIIRTVKRDGLWMAQTPQGFKKDIILQAYRALDQEGAEVTDDAQAVERLGYPVEIVPGSYTNIKITTPEDLRLATAILQGPLNTAS